MEIKKNNRGRKLAERHWIPHEHFWCSKKEFFTIFEKAYGIGVSDGQKLKSHNNEYAAALNILDEYINNDNDAQSLSGLFAWLKERLNSQP